MSDIIGKWVQKEGQAYAGLWFAFYDDGRFEAEYAPMGIESGGTFTVNDGEIDMDQTAHTLGLVGEFKGLYAIDGEELKMALADAPGGDRPADLADARIYIKD